MGKVIVTIETDGKTSLKVEGVAGPACLAATKPYEDALGVVSERRTTAEYFAVPGKAPQKVKMSV